MKQTLAEIIVSTLVQNMNSAFSFFGSLLGTWVGYKIAIKQLKNDPQSAKDYSLILIELLNNLDILKTGLLYGGVYCPAIEHRAPKLSQNDYEADMSYSQRAHFFFMIGRKVIENCRKIIFLVPKKDLPRVLAKVTEIKIFLMDGEEGKNNTLEKIQPAILNAILGNQKGQDDCDNYCKQLSRLYSELDNLIEAELPTLRKS